MVVASTAETSLIEHKLTQAQIICERTNARLRCVLNRANLEMRNELAPLSHRKIALERLLNALRAHQSIEARLDQESQDDPSMNNPVARRVRSDLVARLMFSEDKVGHALEELRSQPLTESDMICAELFQLIDILILELRRSLIESNNCIIVMKSGHKLNSDPPKDYSANDSIGVAKIIENTFAYMQLHIELITRDLGLIEGLFDDSIHVDVLEEQFTAIGEELQRKFSECMTTNTWSAIRQILDCVNALKGVSR